MKINRKLLFFPIVALGVIALIVITKMRPDAEVKPLEDRSKIVDVLLLKKQETAPKVIGFGNIKPKFEWKAIAEVSGKVIYRHPDLNKGNVLLAGTKVLQIDPLHYQLKLAQAEADLNSSNTKLLKLDLEEKNILNTLNIEKKRLALSWQELNRKRNLQKKRLASQSETDQQNQSYLAQQKIVQDIQNQIVLLPNERKVAQAMVNVNQAKFEEAQRALETTSIVLPENVRISSIDIETGQVVNSQQTMFIAHGINVMEMEAQISMHDMQILAQSIVQAADSTAQSSAINMNALPLTANVKLSSGRFSESWPAKVVRISETIDATQATIGVILEIEQDYFAMQSTLLLSLTNGMFVRAEIEGPKSEHWVIPENALHGDSIYLLSDKNKLIIHPVKVLYRRNNQVVISGDIKINDRLILNDLLPAINGMQLRLSNMKNAEDEM